MDEDRKVSLDERRARISALADAKTRQDLDRIRSMLADVYTPEEMEIWLTHPQPQLDGMTAAEAITAGRSADVAAIVQRLSDEVYL